MKETVIKDVNNKRLISKRRKQFLAFVLGTVIGLMPAADVLAETVYVNTNNAGSAVGKNVFPENNDTIVWDPTNETSYIGTGRLRVRFLMVIARFIVTKM